MSSSDLDGAEKLLSPAAPGRVGGALERGEEELGEDGVACVRWMESIVGQKSRSVAANVVHRSEQVHEARALCAGSSSDRCVVGLRQSRDVLPIEAGE